MYIYIYIYTLLCFLLALKKARKSMPCCKSMSCCRNCGLMATHTGIAITAASFTCYKYTHAALLRSPRPGNSKPAIPSQTGSRRQARAVGFSRMVRPGNFQIAWPQNPPLADCLADCFGVLADWARPMLFLASETGF